MRTSGAIVSFAALLWGFLQAPFFHIHPEDLDHPATPTPVHMHVRGASNPAGPTIGALTGDDDAVDVPWSIVQPAGVAFALDLAIAEAAVLIPTPSLVSAALLTPQCRGHDPPDLIPKSPRAPPA